MKINISSIGVRSLSENELKSTNGGWLIEGLIACIIWDCISSGDFEEGFRAARAQK